jgi:hypothetical protein
MRIPTGMYLDARHRCRGEVGRHHRRGTPVEGEWGFDHSAHPHRDKIGNTASVLLLQDGDWVATRPGRPRTVRTTGNGLAEISAAHPDHLKPDRSISIFTEA